MEAIGIAGSLVAGIIYLFAAFSRGKEGASLCAPSDAQETGFRLFTLLPLAPRSHHEPPSPFLERPRILRVSNEKGLRASTRVNDALYSRSTLHAPSCICLFFDRWRTRVDPFRLSFLSLKVRASPYESQIVVIYPRYRLIIVNARTYVRFVHSIIIDIRKWHKYMLCLLPLSFSLSIRLYLSDKKG